MKSNVFGQTLGIKRN